VGIAALGRALARHRRRQLPRAAAPSPVDERAEALRRKLSEARADESPAPAPPPQTTASSDRSSETIDERRARVHAKAQEAIDAMHEALE
jgi:hypothetical protein